MGEQSWQIRGGWFGGTNSKAIHIGQTPLQSRRGLRPYLLALCIKHGGTVLAFIREIAIDNFWEWMKGTYSVSPSLCVVNLLLGQAFFVGARLTAGITPPRCICDQEGREGGMAGSGGGGVWGWGWESRRDLQHSDENPASASAIAGPL